MKKQLISTLVVFLLSFSLLAQSDWIWNQYLYFGDTNQTSIGLWGSAEYAIQSNTLSNQLMNEAVFDGKISSSTSANIVNLNSGGYTRLLAGTNGSIWFRSGRPGNWRWTFGLGYKDQAIGLMKTGVAQLYLKGNGPFEDQTIELGPSDINYHSYQFAGIGIEHGKGPNTWGVSAQLIKSSRHTHVEIGKSGLYTAPYGTSVESSLTLRYDATSYKQPKLSAWYGTGYSLNAYYAYQTSPESPMICFELRDAGQVFYQGVNRLKLEDSLSFSGVEVNNILQLDDSLISGENLDSIEALLGLTSSHPALTAWLPAYINVHYTHPISDKIRLAASLKQYLSFGLPEVRLGIALQPKPWFTIQPTVRFGGFTRFDIGLNMATQLGQSFRLVLKTEQFENLISPKNSTSQYLFVGGQLSF